MWAVWGIVQARESVEGEVVESEFDYLGYGLARMQGFRREIHHLGIHHLHEADTMYITDKR
jgi:choline kinase